MQEEDLQQLVEKVKNLEIDFQDFVYQTARKIGGSGVRESIIQISNGSNLCIGSGNDVLKFDSSGIYLGNAVFASAPFRVSMAGALTATSATISGAITATTGVIGAWNINATSIYTGTEDHSGYTANAGDITLYSDGLNASMHAYNWYIDAGGTLVSRSATVNGSTIAQYEVYGDGSDGTVDINSGAFSSGPITSNALTRDAFFDSLTLSGGNLDCAGFRLFVKGTLTVGNTYSVHRNGNAGGNGGNGGGGAAGTAGAALADGSLKGAIAGVVGKIGIAGNLANANGTAGTTADNGVDVAKSLVDSNAVAGGNSGAGGAVTAPGAQSGGAGKSGGTAGAKTGTVYNKPNNSVSAYLLYDTLPTPDNLKASPSSGGAPSGGSGGANSNNGNSRSGGSGGSGGGGSQGGIVYVAAKTIVLNGNITANGGNGGNAGTSQAGEDFGTNSGLGGGGGSAGGAGGNGGVVIVLYGTKTGAGSITASGGTGGTGATGSAAVISGTGAASAGADGQNGPAGNTGEVIELIV